jgi:hypothetical protein
MKFEKKIKIIPKKIEKLLGLNLTLMDEIEKNKLIKNHAKQKKKLKGLRLNPT